MTENTVPRVAKFADIKVGQTIEHVYTHPSGSTVTYAGRVSKVTAHSAGDDTCFWLAAASDDDDPHVTLRILADPTPKPLPAWGTLVRVIGGEYGGRRAVMAIEGNLYSWSVEGRSSLLRESEITDWEVIHDPNAPDEDPADKNAWVGMCGAMNPDSYICTLDADHTGPHVAMGGSVARATWRDEPPTADPLDETDRRGRIDREGRRIERRGDRHWHAEMTPCPGLCWGYSLADWDAACGPLRIADEVTA